MMERALGLAGRGPETDPNPRVGCVLVRDGRVVGEGHHAGAGTPHAEVVALRAAAGEARDATAYVTLEPCAHTGRTGPCADALVAAGVRSVVYAQADPNPAAAGGADRLRAAGIEVVHDPAHEAAARVLNEVWTTAVGRGRPVVTWKYAAGLDGRAAAADGSSRWISSAAARADAMGERARRQAVLVGTGTVLADDPHLTVRGADDRPVGRQPLRVVLGERDLPEGARVADAAAETVHLRHRDPALALRQLHERGVRSVWLEGGPTVAAAFWRAGVVDDVLAYVAPVLLGAGPAAVGDLGIGTIAEAARLSLTDVTRLGPDLRLRAVPATS